MVVIGLLGYASGLLRAGGEDADALQELYAADAGIAHVKKLLEQGAPVGDISPIEVNGLEVKMDVTPVGTPGAAVPPSQPYPVVPKLPVEHLGPHLVTLNSVPEGTKVDISWAFTRPTPTPTPTPTPIPDPPDPNQPPTLTPTPTPIPTYPSVAVFAGLGGGTPIAKSEPLTEVVPERKYWVDLADIELLDAETYVVDFDPGTTDRPSFRPVHPRLRQPYRSTILPHHAPHGLHRSLHGGPDHSHGIPAADAALDTGDPRRNQLHVLRWGRGLHALLETVPAGRMTAPTGCR